MWRTHHFPFPGARKSALDTTTGLLHCSPTSQASLPSLKTVVSLGGLVGGRLGGCHVGGCTPVPCRLAQDAGIQGRQSIEFERPDGRGIIPRRGARRGVL